MHGGDSRASSPSSSSILVRSSLDDATIRIDDLTEALANFSRVPSPEPQTSLTCCCGRDDCENAKNWSSTKARLEQRLVLSAEIGQALLQRHEAYVRRTERQKRISMSSMATNQPDASQDYMDEINQLTEERKQLEKRLNQVLVNTEVTEVSNRTLQQELQEAQETISRLTAHHARSVGWDTRLSSALKERDDMQQERDGESQRARVAESRFAALKDRTNKLQSEVRKLQQDNEDKRQHRLESSESTIRDARSRLETFQNTHVGQSAATEQAEFTKVVESLVDDNEVLKRDNAELQRLLEETRQEFHDSQQELEEHRALLSPVSRSSAGTPRLRNHGQGHGHTSSLPSSVINQQLNQLNARKSASPERKPRRYLEPLALQPDGDRIPSPAESADSRRLSQPSPRHPPSPFSLQLEHETGTEGEGDQPRQGHRSLILLARSKAVQTDAPWPPPPPSLLSPSPQPTPSPQEGPRSESSSFNSELSGTAGHMSQLLDKAAALLSRMTQADALTLTNRLKRQNLAKGADVAHLSRTTVSAIINEINALRYQFRPLLEDEKITVPCSRKDLRMILRFLKEAFGELGELRVTLNDIILDPGIAPRFSELALDPVKAEAERRKLQNKGASGVSAGGGGWMAPISKLFNAAAGAASSSSSSAAHSSSSTGVPTTRVDSPAGAALARSLSAHGSVTSGTPTRLPPRPVPKLGPALSASATTVNVEFSGSGPGRAMTSTVRDNSHGSGPSRRPSLSTMGGSSSNPNSAGLTAPGGGNSSVLSIFAGAPAGRISPDPWVVLPQGGSGSGSSSPANRTRTNSSHLQPPPFRRATLKPGGNPANRLSRHLDAVIDVDTPAVIEEDEETEFDINAPIVPKQALRRRGMSDSSMHSTFTSHAVEEDRGPQSIAGQMQGGGGYGVLHAISKRVQNLRISSSGSSSSIASDASTTPTAVKKRPTPSTSPTKEAQSGGFGLSPPRLSNLIPTSWNSAINSEDPNAFLVGSLPDDGDVFTSYTGATGGRAASGASPTMRRGPIRDFM